MIHRHWLVTGFFCLGMLLFRVGLANQYTLTPTPTWVKAITTTQDASLNQQDHSNGVAYLLVDYQTRVQPGEPSRYHHFIQQALNPSGLSEVSQIAIDFDPEYESVKLHTLQVHRNGQILDMRARAAITVLQREKELEYQIYDGSKTLNILMEDIRVGDRVEYSYSIDGANPVYAGHFSDYNQMQWSVPVAHVHHRLLWPASRPLQIRNHATNLTPRMQSHGEFTEYVWEQHQAKAIVTDPDIPNWYDPYPVVYLSDMASWQEVAAWAWPLYQPVKGTPQLTAIKDAILASAHTLEDRILAALQYVQNEIRYLGIEIGVRSHQPGLPETVLTQRFGDCKDKSRLLVSLLQDMGIEATPALVNSNRGKRLTDRLPTPTVFNHVIVVVRIGGRQVWLDPTFTYQAGDLTSLYQPNYHYALIIDPSTADLTTMSGDIPGPHRKAVEETFDIRDLIDKPAHYTIVNQYERFFADVMRQDLAEIRHDEVQQNYLKYLARWYPGIRVATPLQVKDEKAINRLSVTEAYQIDDLWETSEDERYLLADFQPSLITDNLEAVDSPIRSMPFSIAHPVRYRHLTRILVPKDSHFANTVDEVIDEAFHFIRTVSFANDVLEIDYRYESRKSYVDAEKIATYTQHINTASDLAYFQIQMPNPAIDFGNYTFDSNDINWPLIGISLVAVILMLGLMIKYVYLYDPPYQAPAAIDTQLEGIRGWLVIPAIGVVLSPVLILVTSSELWFAYSAVQWSMLGDGENGTALQWLIGAETLVNLGLLMWSVVLIALFFQKRHTLPRMYILFLVISLVMSGGDLLATFWAFPDQDLIEASDISQFTRQAISAVIWILYFLKSKRVQATFVRQRQDKTTLGQSAMQSI